MLCKGTVPGLIMEAGKSIYTPTRLKECDVFYTLSQLVLPFTSSITKDYSYSK